MNYSITAIVQFCSYDENFFEPCIKNLLSLGFEVKVMTYDHLYAGEPENIKILEKCEAIFKNNPLFEMIRLKWIPNKSPIFLEAFSRHLGIMMAKNKHLLFLDIDEIVDHLKMKAWLDKGVYKKYKGIRLNFYVYDRLPIYQLKKTHYSIIMCKRWWAQSLGFKEDGRRQFFNNGKTFSRWAAKLGFSFFYYIYRGEPFIHHFTGVRSEKNMETKIKNWGHRDDKEIVEKIVNWRKVKTEDEEFLKAVKIVSNKFKIVI